MRSATQKSCSASRSDASAHPALRAVSQRRRWSPPRSSNSCKRLSTKSPRSTLTWPRLRTTSSSRREDPASRPPQTLPPPTGWRVVFLHGPLTTPHPEPAGVWSSSTVRHSPCPGDGRPRHHVGGNLVLPLCPPSPTPTGWRLVFLPHHPSASLASSRLYGGTDPHVGPVHGPPPMPATRRIARPPGSTRSRRPICTPGGEIPPPRCVR